MCRIRQPIKIWCKMGSGYRLKWHYGKGTFELGWGIPTAKMVDWEWDLIRHDPPFSNEVKLPLSMMANWQNGQKWKKRQDKNGRNTVGISIKSKEYERCWLRRLCIKYLRFWCQNEIDTFRKKCNTWFCHFWLAKEWGHKLRIFVNTILKRSVICWLFWNAMLFIAENVWLTEI